VLSEAANRKGTEMGIQADPEAYKKGYDDAMRAAAGGQGASSSGPSTEPRTKTSKKAKAVPSGRDIGGKVERGIGFAFGWLILFPLFMGLLSGSMSWFFGVDGGFTAWAVGGAGIFFIIALFMGVVVVGFRLFVALWPVVIVGGGIAIAVVKLLG
jgi:hypothetical protein